MYRRIAVEQRMYATGMADTQGWQFELAELAYIRIENAHKVAYAIKVSCLFMWVLYVELLGEKQIRVCVSCSLCLCSIFPEASPESVH